MKTRSILYTLMLGIPLIVVAVPKESHHGERHYLRIEHLSKELNLTGEQKTSLETIFKEQRKKYKALREEGRVRMKEVLSEEQMTKLDEMREQHHERWEKRKAAFKEENLQTKEAASADATP
ncbi:MAG: Spy/CpxP family protein refolding chaperone [Methylococcaceae bacterium]|nr:Spy/CpxP family protein refolding chaperone [Methylococcaceae bacterium]